MGYSTEFDGFIEIHPPLNKQEVEYLKNFANTRRMEREKGPYYVDGTGYSGQGHDNDIKNYNQPPEGQPGLWCKWEPTQDGTKIEWNGIEKFYDSVEWMQYLINHFIGENPIAKKELPFLNKHVLHGEIDAQGDERNDHWYLVVENNKVKQVAANYNSPKMEALDTDLVKRMNEENAEVKEVETKKEVYIKKTNRFNI